MPADLRGWVLEDHLVHLTRLPRSQRPRERVMLFWAADSSKKRDETGLSCLVDGTTLSELWRHLRALARWHGESFFI